MCGTIFPKAIGIKEEVAGTTWRTAHSSWGFILHLHPHWSKQGTLPMPQERLSHSLLTLQGKGYPCCSPGIKQRGISKEQGTNTK